jgi:hypothetical protein
MSFVVGLGVTIALNINTITITERLYTDKELRNAMATYAVQMSARVSEETFNKCHGLSSDESKKLEDAKKDTACAPLLESIEIIQRRNQSLGKLPVGWPIEMPSQAKQSEQSEQKAQTGIEKLSSWFQQESLFWIKISIGWFLTALAVSLGAPFWFDLLNKAVNLRHNVRK